MEVEALHINISADTGGAAQSIAQTASELNKLGDSANDANSDMSQLVQIMSGAASKMLTISQNLAASAGSLDGFKSGMDTLSGALQDVGAKFDWLRSAVGGTYTMFDAASTAVTNLSGAAEASASALSGITSATEGFGDRMSTLQTSTSGTADGMATLRREIKDALGEMSSFSKHMTAAGEDAETTAKKIKGLANEVNKIPDASKITSLASGFKLLKGAVATLGIGKFVKDCNDAYVVQMQNELKLTAHMKQRMGATDEQVQAIKRLASEQQKLGVIGDEIQLAGAQQLTTYAQQSSTLQTLLPAMNNLIAQNAGYEASVGDATSAADMLGRALNGQYTSLKRAGVAFTEAQEQVLKYGTESQKAQVLAEAINSKVGNMNELLANTPTGRLKQLQNDFGDLQEQIGATFQPLISSIIPILSGLMDTLKEPILNVSRGITIIGQAIASIDSPAVRAIGLTIAAVVAFNKLKKAMSGPVALLIMLGTTLVGFLGSTAEKEDDIGKAVEEAFEGAQNSMGGASDAAKNYKDELGKVQKAASKLAGFDTITKLSGGGTGALANAILGDTDKIGDFFSNVKTAGEDAAVDVKKAFDNLKININWFDVGKKLHEWIENIDWNLMLRGLGEAVHDIFSTGFSVIDGIFGSNHQEAYEKTFEHFFDVGENIYKAVQDLNSGDELGVIRGIDSLCRDIVDILTLGLLSDQIEDWDAYWQHVGGSLHDLFNFNDNVAKEHGLYNSDNTPGVINNFISPIEGAPLAAYYRWGSSGMPTTDVPKTAVNSMGLPNYEESKKLLYEKLQKERQLHVPSEVSIDYISGFTKPEFPAPAVNQNNTTYNSTVNYNNRGSIPSSVDPSNIITKAPEVNVYIDSQKQDGIVTNGGGGHYAIY